MENYICYANKEDAGTLALINSKSALQGYTGNTSIIGVRANR